MAGDSSKSSFGRVYLAAIPLTGLALLGWSLSEVVANPPPAGWLILTGLTALTGAYTVRIPGSVVRLSVSEPIVFLATLLYGPSAGTITAAVDALVMSLRLGPKVRTPHRIFFNVGALAITVFPSAVLYFRLAGLDTRAPHYGALDTFVGPLYLFAISVFFFNSWLIAIALSVERAVSPLSIWLKQFLWLAANYLASASIAAILVVFTQAIDLALVALLLPLVVVSFLAFRTTLGRLDDANQHLSEVNRLHLSTIETLAMAIDAKDQVTHGHIRRVQRYAVGLAKALGIADDRQLRAIEAAALLHDMGKLAIPEFILNKPGKLTASEFAVMKTHAALGADILSSIEFPYPVVPIVRYHHENWDGSGYPEGIRGADIPIGARILSVVDCYDALTSDRPYRPAMTADKAIDILSQRRGKMYDPLVVDAFVSAHGALCYEVESEHVPVALLSSPLDVAPESATEDGQIAQTAAIEALRLLACLSPFPSAPPLRAVCLQLIDRLRSIATFETAALFVVSDSTGEVEALFVVGSGAPFLRASRIPIGEQLTGWVTAHRTPVWNSDAALDLATSAARTRLVTGSSMPLVVEGTTIGALTLYGQQGQEITIEQRRSLESLLPTISASLSDALHRPSISIDCRQQHIRDAALAAIDSHLSHARQQVAPSVGAALSLSIEAISHDARAQLSLDSAVRTASAMLSPRNSENRCVLRLGPTQLLLCALNDASTDILELEANAVRRARSLQAFEITTSPVSTPLELQEHARRMTEAATTSKPLSGIRTRQS